MTTKCKRWKARTSYQEPRVNILQFIGQMSSQSAPHGGGGGGALYWLLYSGLTSCKPSFSSPSLLAWATGHNNVFEQIFYNFTEREAEPSPSISSLAVTELCFCEKILF